jgi:hypothetical protein
LDWIEHFFHIDPDGGNGSLELLIDFALAAGIVLLVFRRRIRSFLAKNNRPTDRG